MQQLQQMIGNYKILFVHQTGSQVFCDNCKDVDYIVVIENWDKQRAVYRVGNVEYYCYSQKEFELFSSISTNSPKDVYALSLALGQTVYGVNPLGSYNWFAYKDKAVASILKYLEGQLAGRVFTINNGSRVCSKVLCWAFATYFVIANGAYRLDYGQRDILQRCHDGLLPLEQAKILKTQLQSLQR